MALRAPAAPPAANLPDTIDSPQIIAGVAPVRAAVLACGERNHVGGLVNVQLTISDQGRVVAFELEPDTGGVPLFGCIGVALAAARFPASRHGARAVLSFPMPTPSPP